IAYAVVGWILVEVASVVLPTFKSPEWVMQVFTFMVILGLPVALLFAWAYEMTPEGLKKEKEVDRSQSITGRTGRKLDFSIIGLLVVALSVSVFLNIRGGDESSDGEDVNDRLSIAVLPFTSRSNDPDNVLFTDGIHDDLLTTLAKIGSMKVISRTSVMEYRDTTKNLKEIGAELGVANLMEGAVQRFGNNVRINVQLIDANTDEHLWAETYDRELTTKNLFAIQSEISNEIATALKTTLTPEEQSRISAVPTENLAAYSFYLTGRQHMAERSLEEMQLARQQFKKAIEEDPGFADAYSGLSDSLMLLEYNYRAITWDEARDLVPKYLQTAIALDKDNANVQASLGLYNLTLFEREQVASALPDGVAALERAIELNPNYAQAYFWLASAISFQERSEEESIALQEKALELDPLARIPTVNLGVSYTMLGRHQDAIDQWLKARDLHANYGTPPINLASHLMALGRFDEGLAWALEAYKLDPVSNGRGAANAYFHLGDVESAKAVLADFPPDHPSYLGVQATIARLDGDYEKAYELIRTRIDSEQRSRPGTLDYAAHLAIMVGEYAAARDYFLRASPNLANRTNPELNWQDNTDTVALAYVAQRIGEDEYADILLSRTLEMLEGKPRLGMTGYGNWDVELYAVMGDKEMALAKLREAVDAGWRAVQYLSPWHMKNDPLLESLWGEPEFQAIVAEIEADLTRQRARVDAAQASGDWQPLLALARQTTVAKAAP
ncbi:MAG: tetratricopeptide repeat protein, partial [Gammaproteobacteria bacterium]